MSHFEIQSVTGGDSGDSLKGCRFQPLGGTPPAFDFYDSSASPSILVSSVKKGDPFDLTFAGSDWEIKVTSVSTTEMSGDWRNLNPLGPVEEEEEGTFQAQAGGHKHADPGEEEEARLLALASA